jgi:predicted transposase YbfD/YdcC
MTGITGDAVTIDATGCQTAIAAKIRQKRADYILAVKENQPALYGDIRDYFTFLESKESRWEAFDCWDSGSEKDHRRIEWRNIAVITCLDWLEGGKAWEGLAAVIRHRSSRAVGDKASITDRYYISSMAAPAETFGHVIRGHWSIENQLRWSLDVLFREDASQIRKSRAPENMNVLRKIALAKLRATEVSVKRFSTKRKRFKAAINRQSLFKLLFGK